MYMARTCFAGTKAISYECICGAVWDLFHIIILLTSNIKEDHTVKTWALIYFPTQEQFKCALNNHVKAIVYNASSLILCLVVVKKDNRRCLCSEEKVIKGLQSITNAIKVLGTQS